MKMNLFIIRNIKHVFNKEDFEKLKVPLNEAIGFILDENGSEVISEHHQKNYTSDQNNYDVF